MTDVPCVICKKKHDHRSGDHECVSNLQDSVEALTAEGSELKKLLKEANSALRSAAEIAQRDGKDTNWDAFRSRIAAVLLPQHKYMYPVSGSPNPCADGHDLVSRGDGTAKCADCGELADVTETGAARSGHATVDSREK